MADLVWAQSLTFFGILVLILVMSANKDKFKPKVKQADQGALVQEISWQGW